MAPQFALLVAGLALITTCAACARIDDIAPPADLGQTWVEIDGQTYGARPDATGPIGGGAGYTRI